MLDFEILSLSLSLQPSTRKAIILPAKPPGFSHASLILLSIWLTTNNRFFVYYLLFEIPSTKPFFSSSLYNCVEENRGNVDDGGDEYDIIELFPTLSLLSILLFRAFKVNFIVFSLKFSLFFFWFMGFACLHACCFFFFYLKVWFFRNFASF
jgi:hypothetical protein